MSKFFINRPVFSIVIALLITIAGLLCMMILPVDRYPQITPPQVSVRASYPGADSDVVADGRTGHREAGHRRGRL